MMKCPMCDKPLSYEPCNGTHIYTCPDCPFVGFEYLTKKNTEDLSAYLERKK